MGSSSPHDKPKEWYTREWFIDDESEKRGPYSLEELQLMLTRGQIQPSTRVGKTFSGDDTELIVMDLIQSQIDPTSALLDALQAARQKKSQLKELRENSYQQLAPKKPLPSSLVKILLFLAATVVFGYLFSHFGKDSEPLSGKSSSRAIETTPSSPSPGPIATPSYRSASRVTPSTSSHSSSSSWSTSQSPTQPIRQPAHIRPSYSPSSSLPSGQTDEISQDIENDDRRMEGQDYPQADDMDPYGPGSPPYAPPYPPENGDAYQTSP